MLKRKTKFALWASVAAVGALVPSVAYTQQAPTAQDSFRMKSGFLSLDRAGEIINQLKIISNGKDTATLTGTIPSACAGSIAISTEGNGFAISLTQGSFPDLQTCVKVHGGDDAVTSLSKLPNHSITTTAPNLTVSYLNHIVADEAVPGAGLKADGESVEIKSLAQLHQEAVNAKIDADNAKRAKLEAKVACVRSVDQADEILAQLDSSGLDVSDLIEKLNEKKDQLIKKAGDVELANLTKKVNQAIEDGDAEQFDALENQIYSTLSDHPEWASDTKVGDQLGNLVFAMAKVRTQADQTSQEGIDKAADSFKRALDVDSGLTMSDGLRARMQKAVAKNGDLDVARMEVDYAKFTQARDRQGVYAYYGSDYRKFANLQKGIYESLAKQEKSMGCINGWGARTEKRDNDSKLDDRCSAVEEQIQQLQQAPQLLEQKHAEEIQRARQEMAQRQAPGQQMPQQQYAGQPMAPMPTPQLPGFAQQANPYQPVGPMMGATGVGSSTYGAAGIPVSGAGAYQPLYYGSSYSQTGIGAPIRFQ